MARRPQAAPDAGLAAGVSAFAGFASGFASALASAGLGAAADSAFASALASPPPFSLRLRFLSPSFLKSVSYQPLPDSRKLGAVTRRLTASAPHSGQAAGSGSDNFCRRSNWCSQAWQEKA